MKVCFEIQKKYIFLYTSSNSRNRSFIKSHLNIQPEIINRVGINDNIMLMLPSWCPAYSSVKVDPSTGSEVFCICKKPDEGDLMVGCDGCDDWFHFKCMKIPEKYSHLVSGYYCPYCQAGITGTPLESGEFPRTKWKRKCRLDNCYEPCQDRSKYCSEAHGRLYIQTLLDKVSVPGHDSKRFIGDMIRASNDDVNQFNEMGDKDFIDKDIPKHMINQELYDKIIKNDKDLNNLNDQINVCKNKTFPGLKDNLEILQNFIKWLDSVNTLLNTNETNVNDVDDTTHVGNKRKSKKKKGVQRHKVKKICGYTRNLKDVTLSCEEFISQYCKLMEQEEEEAYADEMLNGVCIKLKCNKHSDWTSMRLDQLKQQMRSLESHKQRLDLLVKTREKQLHIQYYEQLLVLKQQLQQPIALTQ